MWVSVLILVAGIGGGVAAALLGSHNEHFSPPKLLNGNFVSSDTVIRPWAVLVLVICVVVIVVALFALVARSDRRRFQDIPTRRARIEKLTASLEDALFTIEQIKAEVDDGTQLLARLERDAEVKGRLAELKTEEAEAVLAQLQETVRLETNRGTRLQLGIGALFFALGCVFTLLITR